MAISITFGDQSREGRTDEMQTGIWNQIGLKGSHALSGNSFVLKRGDQRGGCLSNEPVDVGVVRSIYFQVLTHDLVQRLIVVEHCQVRMLEEEMG